MQGVDPFSGTIQLAGILHGPFGNVANWCPLQVQHQAVTVSTWELPDFPGHRLFPTSKYGRDNPTMGILVTGQSNF
jgi:hypothetical protein